MHWKIINLVGFYLKQESKDNVVGDTKTKIGFWWDKILLGSYWAGVNLFRLFFNDFVGGEKSADAE